MNAKRTKARKEKAKPGAPETGHEDPMQAPAGLAQEEESIPADVPTEEDRLNDRLKRLQADFDNFRKRMQRERQELISTASEELIVDLLPLLDHFELGLRNARDHEANASVIEGFQIVYDQLMAVLAQAGLQPLEAMEQPFDPHLHEAVTHLPSEEYPADVVMAQTRRGFMLGSKLVRAAQVVVSSGPQDQPGARGETTEHDHDEA